MCKTKLLLIVLLGVACFRTAAQDGEIDFTGTYDGVLVTTRPDDPNFRYEQTFRFVVVQTDNTLTIRSFGIGFVGQASMGTPFHLIETEEVVGDTFTADGTHLLFLEDEPFVALDISGSLVGGVISIAFRPAPENSGPGFDSHTDFSGELVSDRLFWDAQSGDFADPANWNPARIPAHFDAVVFNRAEEYTVSIEQAVSRSVLVDGGVVTFRGGGYFAGDVPVFELIVGATASAELRFHDHVMNALDTIVGRDSDAVGRLVVEEGSIWQNSGPVRVGLSGTGTVDMRGGSSASAPEVTIGVNETGDGLVTVESEASAGEQSIQTVWFVGPLVIGQDGFGGLVVAGGEISSADTVVGQNAGGVGVVELGPACDTTGGEATQFFVSSWDTEDLIIGASGTGRVFVTDSVLGTGDKAVVGDQVTGRGDIIFDGIDRDAEWLLNEGTNVFLGVAGSGSMYVQDGNVITLPADLVLAVEPGSSGAVVLEGLDEPPRNSGLTVQRLLWAGVAGEGMVVVSNSVLETNIAFLGVGEGGRGQVVLDGLQSLWQSRGGIEVGQVQGPEFKGDTPTVLSEGTLTLSDGIVFMNDDILTVNAGSRIEGHGTILDVAIVVGEGILDPEVEVFFEVPAPEGGGEVKRTSSKQAEAAGRTLEFGGDLMWTGGRIDIAVDGGAAGEFDQVVVRGDASLTDTTIAIQFTGDFAPTTGEQFPILVVDGALTTDNLQLETIGTDADFQFDTSAGGTLMLTTTSGAEGEGEGEGEGEDTGGGPSALDCSPGDRGPGGIDHVGDLFLLIVVMAVLIQMKFVRRVGEQCIRAEVEHSDQTI